MKTIVSSRWQAKQFAGCCLIRCCYCLVYEQVKLFRLVQLLYSLLDQFGECWKAQTDDTYHCYL